METDWHAFAEVFYSGAGGEVDECMLMLRFFGDDLDPNEITRLLGVEPTRSHQKDDSRKGNPAVRETTGLWLLECERTADTADNQIQLLLSDLTQDLTVWTSLSRRFSAGIKVHLYLERWCRETILSSVTIGQLAERGLKLNIDIYSQRPKVA